MDHTTIMLFDGFCNLCTSLVHFLLRRDTSESFSFVPAQSVAGRKLIESHKLQEKALNTVVLIEGDEIYEQSEALIHMARRLPFPWKLWSFVRIVPRTIRDWVYGILAANRYRWFGKRDACFIGAPAYAKQSLQNDASRTARQK